MAAVLCRFNITLGLETAGVRLQVWHMLHVLPVMHASYEYIHTWYTRMTQMKKKKRICVWARKITQNSYWYLQAEAWCDSAIARLTGCGVYSLQQYQVGFWELHTVGTRRYIWITTIWLEIGDAAAGAISHRHWSGIPVVPGTVLQSVPGYCCAMFQFDSCLGTK